MNSDELDNILLSEKRIEPASFFVDQVMARIQAEASSDRGIPFPWLLFTAAIVAVGIATFLFLPAHAVVLTMHGLCYGIGKWIISPPDMALRNALLSGFASLIGTLMLVWFSFRLAGSRQ